jgi:hypothetical protein
MAEPFASDGKHVLIAGNQVGSCAFCRNTRRAATVTLASYGASRGVGKNSFEPMNEGERQE